MLPAAVDGKVARINFVNNRLLIYTNISRDIWDDARKLERWLNVVALSEVRFMLDYAIVQGVTGTSAAPLGIVNGPGTVTVSKGSTGSSSISTANIDAQWSAMYAGSRENCVWLANDDTIQKIDQLATGSSATSWAETPYIGYVPAGRYGQPFTTLKGRPLIACEACPVIGNPGDLICWDPTDWIFTYLEAPSNIGAISIGVSEPVGPHSTGIVGLPDNVLERRASADVFFQNDEIALLWKLRGDCKSLWGSTMTNVNGATVGNAAIIAQR